MAAEHVRALGERIRLRREELGMTQDEVARQMKGSVDGQRISKWERGENRPRDESLEDLARVLKTTPFELLLPAPNGQPTPDLSAVVPIAAQDAVMDRLDAIDKRLKNLEEMVTQGLDQLAQALSASAVEQADRIVQGIVADVASGKLRVPPPRSKPGATKRAPKRTRAA